MAPLSSAPSSRPDPSASASARPADPAEVPATTILRATASTPELQSIHSQLRVLEQTSVALRRTESKLLKDTESCRGEVVAQIKRVKTLQSLMLEQGASKQELEEIDELSKRLDNLDSRFPRPSRAMLRLSLGSANVAMAFKDRFRYKAEYETFKFRFTIIQLALAAAVLFLITGSGNMYTTLRIYHGKLVRSRNLREAVRRATEKERQRQNLLKHQPACGTAAAPGPAAPPVVVPDAAPAPAEPHPEPVSQPPPEPAPAVSRPRVVFSNDDPDVEPGAEPPGTGDLEHSVDEETDTVVISSSARIPSEQADIRMVNAS
ncbi:hypothetical protein H696_02672 [Fonticula alba]|uniref:Uncharacterized protein n=1 Tax=Fonticula alba TaxID=691883 RepID=A0A058Z7T8_FONAL|nr:hypothetical protein H696_02672 [Fonticula alba]KCV70345.1 hypothetical protein H696_02672 [Fonticula alba]|eukprot:XP_009494861.1 hypothetical protein H696_02672 [Fonticula alba]